jgi:L-lactate dehydrogenase (cytochrome)
LIDVEECNTSCKMLGEDTSLPIFISPAGMAGLAHPLAEKGLAKAAGVCGIIQMVRRERRQPRGARLIFLVST